MSDNLCPYCGSYSPRRCELDEEAGGICPWDESGEYEEPSPDRLREDRDERERLNNEWRANPLVNRASTTPFGSQP
jgi:hypothetical protein